MGFMGLVVWQFDKIQPQVAAMVGQAPTATPPAAFFWQAADNAYWRGDLATAISNYRAVVKQQPSNVDLLYELARVLIYHSYDDRRNTKADETEALDWATKAVDSNPSNARAFAIDCFALETIGRAEDSVRACIRSIDLNPNGADAHAYLAAAYSDLSRFDTALQEGEKAVELDPKNIDAHTYLGWVLRYKGRNDAALDELKKAADINPQLEFPYFNLAYLSIGLNKYEIAIQAYTKVLSMDKSSVKAYTRLCETYYRMGETNLAKDNCNNAINLDDGYTAAHKWLGQILYVRRDYEDAITQFETCATQENQSLSNQEITHDDFLTECWSLHGLAWFLLGDCDKAMPIFNDLLSWTHDKKAIELANTGINKCATTYQGLYKTPTPIPPSPVPPEPIQ